MSEKINKNNFSYLNYVINLKRSNIAYIFLLLAILPRVLWMTKDLIPTTSLFQINLNFAFKDFTENLNFFNATFLKFLSITWIFIVISIFEFSKSRNLETLSLARLKYSNGGKYADLIYFLISLFSFKFRYLNIIATLGIASISDNFKVFLNQTYNQIIPIDLFSNIFSIFFIFILGLLLFELGEYITHRISHKYFWELHEFHHSATEMTILNVNRGSPLEGALTSLFSLPLLLLAVTIINQALEQGQWAIFVLWTIFGVIGECFGYIGHSSLKLTFPKPISLIFMSPSLHWIHHSNNPKHFNKNFGRVLSIWDRIFGTYLDESNLKDVSSFGVDNSEYNKRHPLFAIYLLPFKRLFQKIKYLLPLNY